MTGFPHQLLPETDEASLGWAEKLKDFDSLDALADNPQAVEARMLERRKALRAAR